MQNVSLLQPVLLDRSVGKTVPELT